MRKISLLTFTTLLITVGFTACSHTSKIKKSSRTKIQIPNESKQLLLVTTEDWSSKDGKLQRYIKRDTKWKKVGEAITVVIGRNGLGWGLGLHKVPKDAQYIKKEGDGKAPAGLFTLTHAFGYTPTDFSIDYPYSTYSKTDHCVDDSHSIWYNKIIDSTKEKKDYRSFEHMRLESNLYKYGIVVNHNPNQKAEAGSCIFIHIKDESGKGTAGCTAMKEDKIVNILKWLERDKRPLLLQLPKDEMLKIDFI